MVAGCTTSRFYRFTQSLDMSAEDYTLEKVGLAQAAGIPFASAFDDIVQGLHEILTPVESQFLIIRPRT